MVTAPIVTVTNVGLATSKPPRRAYRCTITVSAPKTGAGWALLPTTLDHPLTDTMPIASIDLRKDGAGQVFLQGNDGPGFVAFRMPPSGRLRIVDWELSTFNRVTAGEILLVSEVSLTSGGTLCDLAAGPLAPPAELPQHPAVLAQWSAPAQTLAIAVEPVRATFRISAGTV